MTAAFQIVTPREIEYQERVGQSFSASVRRGCCYAVLAASPLAAGCVPNIKSIENPYQIVFADNGVSYNDLSVALGQDYEAQRLMVKELDSLKNSLEGDWNGENDDPIEEDAYQNARNAFLSTPGVWLKKWRLFPNPNGTLFLTPKDGKIGGISIGNSELSYAAYISDRHQISGTEPFSIESFKAAISLIHRIFGYV